MTFLETAMPSIRRVNLSLALFLLLSIPANSAEGGGHLLGGSSKSPVKIEVFSDFECPHCREFFLNVIRQILSEYSSKGSVCVIYHEFPMPQHKYAREAARYAEAASRVNQQTLVKVHETLFKLQPDWIEDGKIEAALLKTMTAQDVSKLKEIMKDPSINAAIDKEFQLGMKNEITGTPTMFISYSGKQKRVEMSKGPLVFETMKHFIDQVLN
jgi:protein-disulfide isomerase